ncbi:MAG: glycosyltransferase [Pyrinomonadaceae bacterium]
MMSTISIIGKPKLSVIIASQNASRSIRDCLHSLIRQVVDGEVEIVVIDNSTDETTEIVKLEFPEIVLIEADKKSLIPELWGVGIHESSGDYVALTTSHFVPADNWISEILRAHKQPHAGVGGAIENAEQEGLVSWAIYFCRYSPYMLPFGAAEVEDFAADNASYKRDDLDTVKEAMKDGFWETFVHKEMRAKEMTLVKLPEIIVYHRKSFTFAGFMKQRFWHGRQFGETLASQIAASKRLALILLSPLIPAIYLFRITRRVFGKKRNRDKLLVSSPILALFLLSWSLGEFSGYLSGGKK